MKENIQKAFTCIGVILMGVAVNFIYMYVLLAIVPEKFECLMYVFGYLPIMISSAIIGVKIYSSRKNKMMIGMCSLIISYVILRVLIIVWLYISMINFD